MRLFVSIVFGGCLAGLVYIGIPKDFKGCRLRGGGVLYCLTAHP